MTSAGPDQALVDMINAVLSEHREREDGTGPGGELWDRLRSLGLTRLTGSAEAGGSGGTWIEAAALASAAAATGIQLPLVENDLLAGWSLERAGLPVDDRSRTVCVVGDGGVARRVPWASVVDAVVVLWRDGEGWRVADVPRESLRTVPGENMAKQPRDDVHVDVGQLTGTPVPHDHAEQILLRGALARAVQMCGAMDEVSRMSVRYATERTQFGRALSRFQSVQNLIADLAAEAALARVAVDAAVRDVTSDPSASALWRAVGVAKSCAGHASEVVVRNAHQVHGAIGTTAEHGLHRLTMPLLAWRSECGSTRYWDEELGAKVLQAGPSTWSWVIGTQDTDDSQRSPHQN